jgi:hypothetical protein
MTRRLPDRHCLWIASAVLAVAAGCSGGTGQDGQQRGPETPPADPSAAAPAAQPQAASSPAGPTPDARRLLLAAIRELDAHDSISAQIRQEVDLFGHRLVGTGVYLQQRTGGVDRFRMELKLQLGDRPSSLVQVCDGQYLWVYRTLGDAPPLVRIDAQRVEEAMQGAGGLANTGSLGVMPSLGGIPKLLSSLDAWFEFTEAVPGRWGRQRQAVWRLTGRWKAGRLAQLLPEQKDAAAKGNLPEGTALPDYLPARAVLVLGQEDLFPYHLEYLRADGLAAGGGTESDAQPMVTMDLFEVNVNVPIDPGRFLYNPGETDFVDQTDAVLERLAAGR